MEEKKRFDLDVEIDVFRDRGENACVCYAKILRKFGLDLNKDTDNPIVKNYAELIDLLNDYYKIKSYEELDKAEARMIELWKFCNEFL